MKEAAGRSKVNYICAMQCRSSLAEFAVDSRVVVLPLRLLEACVLTVGF